MKRNKPICRYQFPIPPMPQTVVLAPLDEDDDFSTAATTSQNIVVYLNSLKFRDSAVEMSFQDFLSELQINMDCYFRAVRSSLKQEKVFFKRNPNEVRINSFNDILLKKLILEITRQFKIQMNGSYHVKRRQFPLRLGAAKTIHKAQGSTMKSAVINFGTRKNDHMHYVGITCSRVTHIENLHITYLNEKNVAAANCVVSLYYSSDII